MLSRYVQLCQHPCWPDCTPKKVFIDKDAEYILKEVSDSEIEDEQYYVKDTTSFFKTLEPSITESGKADKIANPKKLIWVGKDESLIPTMYSDGLIAYSTQQAVDVTESAAEDNESETTKNTKSLERYKSIGASFGVYGAEFDVDGNSSYGFSKHKHDGRT